MMSKLMRSEDEPRGPVVAGAAARIQRSQAAGSTSGHEALLRLGSGFPDPTGVSERARMIAAMQQRFGNRYVQRFMARSTGSSFEAMPWPVSEASPAGSAGEPLDAGTRSFMQQRFGFDFANVRVHTSVQASEIANGLAADAFTVGRDIYFNGAAYDPSSPRGRRLIAHELTHVVQQSLGSPSGRVISEPADQAEIEAESVARQVTETGVPPRGLRSKPAAIVQRCRRGTAPAPVAAPAPVPHPPAGFAGAQVQSAPSVALTPDQRRQLLFASTTLRRVEQLSDRDQALLERAIPGVLIVTFIRERREKTEQLERARHELLVITPEHGVPLPDSPLAHQISTLNQEIANLTADIDRLNRFIQAGLRALSVATEEQLVTLVTEEFPRRFVERAKLIAVTELEQNRELAQREADRYGVRTGTPADRNRLRAAAADLAARTREINDLEMQLQRARSDVDLPSGGMPDPAHMSSSYYEVQHLPPRIAQHTNELQQQRQLYQVQFPILQQDLNFELLSRASDAQLESLVGEPVRRILDNIRETQANIASGELKVWNLNNIVEMTVQDLGIGSNAGLMAVVQQHQQREQTARAILDLGIAALSLTASIVAIFATGGLALVAAGVVLAAGTYTAVQHYQAYQAETAASNVALDPRVADISRNDPDLFWLVVDIAGVILDAVQVVQAFNRMRTVARALVDTGALGEFARTARRILPPRAAERAILSASAQARVQFAISNTVRTVGAQFHHVDMAQVTRRIEEIAGAGFRRVLDDLRAQGRFHPLTREALESVYGAGNRIGIHTQADVLARADGFYDTGRGMMFIRPGSVEVVSSKIIHETTHYLQQFHGASLTSFMEEFEALSMERAFLTRMAFESGEATVPAEFRWLRSASDEEIAARITRAYGFAAPSQINGAEAVRNVLRRVAQY